MLVGASMSVERFSYTAGYEPRLHRDLILMIKINITGTNKLATSRASQHLVG